MHQTSPALYIHIPFCRAKCSYCDFNSYPGLTHLYRTYCDALAAEAKGLAHRFTRSPASVYLGGGTPTALPIRLLKHVLRACDVAFGLADAAEITVECNPGTVARSSLRALRALGVNRLSLGVQSLDAQELAMLGRIHGAEQAGDAVRQARAAGFPNLSLDMIFGLPGQGIAGWRTSLERALALAPQHLSLYALSLEEGTLLHERVRRGELPNPDPDLAADMLELAGELLDRAGFGRYEISNWSLPGFECAHNLVYWRNLPYTGLGAGAHSSESERRWWNVRSVTDYIERLGTAQPGEWPSPAAEGGENLDRPLQMGETMMLGLRLTREGVAEEAFAQRFGVSLSDVYGEVLRELVEQGLVTWELGRVRLTPRGCMVGNQVFLRFLPD